jgi:NAD(P)H dehydrogenase (quinone)
MSDKLLVTGASGHLGRRVVEHLLTTLKVEPSRIVAASRSPEQLAEFAAGGVETRKVDFDDEATLGSAFEGVGRVLLISTGTLREPGYRATQHKRAIAAAEKAGVRHIVYTSMPNPEDSLVPIWHDHLGTEQALRASSLSWTMLRNCWYMENLFGSLPGVLASGQWFTATGDGRVGQVSREDCARAAAAVLASADTEKRIYTITGPEALTTADFAAIASEVFDKPIEVVQVSDEQLIAGMVAHGVPEAAAPVYAAFEANTREGKVDIVTGDVEALTGIRPQSFRDFLGANKAALGA